MSDVSPAPADVAAAWCATFFDELVRGGVGHAVVCPGSRSTPLALAAVTEPGLRVHVRLDERSAAFTALGIGLATGRPAVVVVTSGTAAAELHAAVVEADLSRVPLIVVTADRPPELRDVGAPQTIDQDRLFGAATRWFHDPGVPDPITRPRWRSLAARVVAAAEGGGVGSTGPGPVHLNVPFREPLVGRPDVVGVPAGREDGSPWHRRETPSSVPPGGESGVGTPPPAHPALDRPRGVLVAGALPSGAGLSDAHRVRQAVLDLAARTGWPVLAEPRSGLVSTGGSTGPTGPTGPVVVTAAESVVRSERFVASHRPEIVVRLGPPWASKVVNSWMADQAEAGATVVVVDPWDRWADPDGVAAVVVRADVATWCGERAAAAGPPSADPGWSGEWAAADAAARRVLGGLADPGAPLSEPALAHRLTAVLPDDALLVVASSMPVRDVEAFADRRRPLKVVANRGANGIDGVVSTALGAALGTGRPTVALVGDLAFLHDISALVGVTSTPAPLTVVVVDNGGGGIFSFLGQATAVTPDTFERLFGTPSGNDVVAVARGFGCSVDDVDSAPGGADLEEVLGRHLADPACSVVRIRVPARAANVELHRTLATALVGAVDAVASEWAGASDRVDRAEGQAPVRR